MRGGGLARGGVKRGAGGGEKGAGSGEEGGVREGEEAESDLLKNRLRSSAQSLSLLAWSLPTPFP